MFCCENAYDGAACTDECNKRPLILLTEIANLWQHHNTLSYTLPFDIRHLLDEAEEFIKAKNLLRDQSLNLLTH